MSKQKQNGPKEAQGDPKGCLICGDLKTKLRRGLCGKHYEQLRRKKAKLTPEGVFELESQMIEAGYLLPEHHGAGDPINDIFNKVTLANPGLLKTAAQMAEEIETEDLMDDHNRQMAADKKRKETEEALTGKTAKKGSRKKKSG